MKLKIPNSKAWIWATLRYFLTLSMSIFYNCAERIMIPAKLLGVYINVETLIRDLYGGILTPPDRKLDLLMFLNVLTHSLKGNVKIYLHELEEELERSCGFIRSAVANSFKLQQNATTHSIMFDFFQQTIVGLPCYYEQTQLCFTFFSKKLQRYKPYRTRAF